MTWAHIILLILSEAPQLVQFLQQLQQAGRTAPTSDELTALGLADADLAAAYAKLFPGQTPPAP